MLEELVEGYAAYLKTDISGEFRTIQDVIDNMLTRLEELTSVLQMIKSKNSECGALISDEIIKYRSEITTLSKKILTLNKVILHLHNNIDFLEKQVEKAEIDFGTHNDSRLKNFLLPFMKKSKDKPVVNTVIKPDNVQFDSVLKYFEKPGT